MTHKPNGIYAELVKQVWENVYNPKINSTETIERFFHPDYEQCINGVKMNRSQYIVHVNEQRKNMVIDGIDYMHTLEKDNELFTIYYGRGQSKNGQPIEAEVIAYFQFKDQQIIKIHGQVRLIKGEQADVDMND